MENEITKREIFSFQRSAFENKLDFIAVEDTLEISLGFWEVEKFVSKNISITMRTPGADRELAVGFLFGEGIVKHPNEIEKIDSEQNKVLIFLKKGVIFNLNTIERHFYTSSSCGVCGKSSTDAVKLVSNSQKNESNFSLSSELILKLPSKMSEKQVNFQQTGGLHSSSLFSEKGEFILLFEDVGRHNALDKLIGSAFLNGNLPLKNNILLLSGRISFELVQKAIFAGISVICAIGAPSSLAIDLAKEFNICLIGFLKKNSFNVYHGAERFL
jgi:FdhD protein